MYFDRRKLCFGSFSRSKISFTYKRLCLHFKQERHNWSPTFFNPFSPSALFYTHAHKQSNVASKHVLKSFPSKKNAAVFRAGPLTRPAPPPAGGFGGRFRRPCYRIRGPAHKLLSSFLKRKQFVSLNHVNSELRYINHGVPQGSILRPLLFLLYENDMPQAVANTSRLFSDDTCLLLHVSNPTSLLSTLNLKMFLLLEWCSSNKLTINPQKSHLLIIPPTKNSNHMDLSISLNDTTIHAENSVKYLGVLIDTNLNFLDHLTTIALKILWTVGILYKLKFVLPQNALQTL